MKSLSNQQKLASGFLGLLTENTKTKGGQAGKTFLAIKQNERLTQTGIILVILKLRN